MSVAYASIDRSNLPGRYQLLADLLVGRAAASSVGDETGWHAVLALAEAEGVAPLLDHALRAQPAGQVPKPARAILASAYQDAVYSSLLHQSVRARLCRRLSERGVPLLLLKGGALAFSCYEDPATRPMVDLDLLVPPPRLEEAGRCLEEEGFRLREDLSASPRHSLRGGGTAPKEWSRFWRRDRRGPGEDRSVSPRHSPRGHLVYLHPATRAMVELHWELRVLGRAQREALPEIWSGALPADTGDAARMMRWGHVIPLLSAHLILQHQCARMLWLYDLHRVLLAADAREAAVAREAATRWRLVPCTAHALVRVQELFGTPLPEELYGWAVAAASRDSLQSRIAVLSLTPGARELPSPDLVDLVMNRDRALLRGLFPSPRVLRERLGLAPRESVAPAYLALMARHLRNGPGYLRQLWRCWRSAPRPRPIGDEAAPPRTECAAGSEVRGATDRETA